MRKLLAAMALLVPVASGVHAQEPAATTPAPAAAPVAAVMPVYDTALAPGWQNWSWAKTELGVELNGSTRRPIRVDAEAWAALYLHHDAFSTAPYRSLNLLLHGAGTGGQQVRIIAVIGGTPMVDKAKLVTIAPGGWTQVQVPLATIGAENVMLDGIWIQNATDQTLPHFYATEIALRY